MNSYFCSVVRLVGNGFGWQRFRLGNGFEFAPSSITRPMADRRSEQNRRCKESYFARRSAASVAQRRERSEGQRAPQVQRGKCRKRGTKPGAFPSALG